MTIPFRRRRAERRLQVHVKGWIAGRAEVAEIPSFEYCAAVAPERTPPRDDGLLLAALLAFRIYDGYQRNNSSTRGTL